MKTIKITVESEGNKVGELNLEYVDELKDIDVLLGMVDRYFSDKLKQIVIGKSQ